MPDRLGGQAAHQNRGEHVSVLRDPLDQLIQRGFEPRDFFKIVTAFGQVIFCGHGWASEGEARRVQARQEGPCQSGADLVAGTRSSGTTPDYQESRRRARSNRLALARLTTRGSAPKVDESKIRRVDHARGARSRISRTTRPGWPSIKLPEPPGRSKATCLSS